MKAAQHQELINTLEERFRQHMIRHGGMDWSLVLARLEAHPAKVAVLQGMETTGGEPDVVGRDQESGGVVFCDCSPESPMGRRRFAMIATPWTRERKTSPRDARWKRPRTWALSCSRSSTIGRCRSLGSLTGRPQAGSGPRTRSESGGAPFSAIGDMGASLSTTTARSPTSRPGASVAGWWCEPGAGGAE